MLLFIICLLIWLSFLSLVKLIPLYYLALIVFKALFFLALVVSKALLFLYIAVLILFPFKIYSIFVILNFFYHNWKNIIFILCFCTLTFPFSLAFLVTLFIISILMFFPKKWRINIEIALIFVILNFIIKQHICLFFKNISIQDFITDPWIGIPMALIIPIIKLYVKPYVENLEKDNLSPYPTYEIICYILLLLLEIIILVIILYYIHKPV